MTKQMLIASCVLMLAASPTLAQSGSGSGAGAGSGSGQSTQKDAKPASTTIKPEEGQPSSRFVRTLTNVQIELNLSDQSGTETPEKKTVSMIVSSGNWGKIRSVANTSRPGEPPSMAQLDVDARPLVSVDGPIQLELTLNYAPPGAPRPADKPGPRPTGINQSQTLILQSGKPLIISQAADPINDRKVVVEVKATVLK